MAGEDTQETYELNTLGLVSHKVSSASPLSFVFGGEWWRPVRGKYREAMTYEAFYAALGRPDLAERHAQRELTSNILIFGGVALEIGGAVVFFYSLFENEGMTAVGWIGLGAFVGGFTMTAIGASMDKPPITEDEAIDMASRYNSALKSHLGLSPLSLRTRLPRAGRPALALRPVIGPQSTGLTLRAAF
jgi:hypothetical protein